MKGTDLSSTSSETICVKVLFFSVLREAIGTDGVDLSIPASATGEDLLDLLEERYPPVGKHRSDARLAVNQSFADPSTALSDGDEVALITPVSGG
jgi:molybdopterin converting factor subunit 1